MVRRNFLSTLLPDKLLQGKYSAAIVSFLAGAILPLAFSPVDVVLFSIVSPLILFYILSTVTPKRAAWLGWWYGLGFFFIGVSWVFIAIHVFGFTDLFTSIILTFLFVAFWALCIGFQGYLSVWLVKRFSVSSSLTIFVIIFPATWLFMEWVRGWLLTGFPWLSLGYSQTDTYLSGYASIVGVYGISWLVAISAGLVLVIIQNQKYRVHAMVIISVIWSGGYLVNDIQWTEKSGKPLKVSLVQGNVPQITKWDPYQFELRKSRYLSLTRQHWDSDLIIWPENSLTLFYHQLEDSFLYPMMLEAKKNNTDIILGLPVLNKETKEYYSSFLRLGETPQFYHKTHLVPFGEYVPLGKLLRGLIAVFDLPMSGFSAGSFSQPVLEAAGQKIAPTICYEDTFGEELIRFLPEASLIINGSNNAWYGDSFAPHQHLQISRMRAIETGRALLRVTTNGVSALIDYKGKILKRSPQFMTNVLTGEVQPRAGATPYVRWGNYFILIMVMIILASGLFLSAKNNREKS